ncbi:fatty acid desaturase [Streptomyces sp. NPDC002740]
MLLALAALTAGITLRQIDRIHFARHRPRTADAPELIALQRTRANNVTPFLLLAAQWIQVIGWWMLAAHGQLLAAVAAVGIAIHFRHLQEISHFAVHGVLARTPRANLLLAEIFAHHPLVLGPLPVRRRRHVRDHHPHATLASDPNLAELHQAGLRPGTSGPRYAAALIHPLTPSGIRATAVSTAANLRGPGAWHRAAAPAAVAAAAYLAGGWTALVCGLLIPRLLLYPQLAWMSLLVEHTWFDPDHRTGTPAQVEAGRCLRLYPRNRALAAFTAATWLPYGDLYHYAHSAHPAVRWTYLPALDRHLAAPHFTPGALMVGTGSVARRHREALASGIVAAPAPVAGASRTPAT